MKHFKLCFVTVTETFDNDGLAYALTMLIFAGSENCPHYSNLYFWNNRNLGNIISGNVLKDRTYFTLSAAGSKAFLTLMPMFVDHILYPSLKVKICVYVSKKTKSLFMC